MLSEKVELPGIEPGSKQAAKVLSTCLVPVLIVGKSLARNKPLISLVPEFRYRIGTRPVTISPFSDAPDGPPARWVARGTNGTQSV